MKTLFAVVVTIAMLSPAFLILLVFVEHICR